MLVPNKLFIPGAFDVLHIGHISFITNSIKHFLSNYNKLPSTIIFYLPSDKFLYKRKGQFRPFFPIHIRQKDITDFMLRHYPEIKLEFKINNNYQIKLDNKKNLTLKDILNNYNIKDIETTVIAQGPDYYQVYQILKSNNIHVIVDTSPKSPKSTSYIEKTLLTNDAPLIIFRNYKIHSIFRNINLDITTTLQKIQQDDYIFTKHLLPQNLLEQLVNKNIKRYIYLFTPTSGTGKSCDILKRHQIFCKKAGL